MTKDTSWQHYPTLSIPSPVLALTPGAGGIWAGGTGGIAWRAANDEWQPRLSGLPLTAVTALEFVNDLLIAGGTDGIARSTDQGKTWQRANVQEGRASIMALAISPNFASDQTLLAATLESGIVRSNNGGKNWISSTFGLQSFEMSALIWGKGETVVAGSLDGIYRSSNGGRAWRLVRDSAGLTIAALAYQTDGTFLAATEDGQLLRSTDGGVRWQHFGNVPEALQCSTLWSTRQGSLLLGSGEHGLLRSTDDGNHWDEVLAETALSFGVNEQILYVGTGNGLYVSVDDGASWRALPHPPIHDLHHLLPHKEQLLVMGMHAGLRRYTEKHEWLAVPHTPYPLAGATIAPDGTLLAASLDGLVRSEDDGTSWQTVIEGEAGNLAHFSWHADGYGYAGSLDGKYLYRTNDGGKTWEQLQAPFGVLPLVALQAVKDGLIAACYDPRQSSARIWRSQDQGETWRHELEAQTSWPLVSLCPEPQLVTLGDSVLHYEQGQWRQTVPEAGTGGRRIQGNGRELFELTTTGILRSSDNGQSWQHDDAELPTEEILDLAVTEQKLYVLLTDGRVWARDI